jgi:CheY-like chemotaxis protein
MRPRQGAPGRGIGARAGSPGIAAWRGPAPRKILRPLRQIAASPFHRVDKCDTLGPMQSYVLVIDDDAAVREFVTGLLGDEGYPVRNAADAYQAMDEVSSAAPDLLIVDLMMPGVNGAEFLTRLRRDGRWVDLPVILISAHPRLREIAEDLHVQVALAKPFDIGQLLDSVGRIIGPPLPVPPALNTDRY